MINFEPHEDYKPIKSPVLLSIMEHSVLSVFHTYLMTPGKMLCLNGKAFDEFKLPLAQLKHKGMLIEERYKGAYSLTDIGYAAMRRKNMSRA